MLTSIPRELQLLPRNGDPSSFSVCPRSDLKAFTRFGPYQAKIHKDPSPTSNNWKVTDAAGTFTAWMELVDFNALQWITCLKKADARTDQHKNTILLLFRGQLYVELRRDVSVGEELRLLQDQALLVPEETSSTHKEHQLKKEQRREYLKADASEHGAEDASEEEEEEEDSASGEREYKCNQCPKVYNWKSNLIRHQVAHDESRRYVCETCKKVSTDPSNLQRHIRSQHIGARSHACAECGKTFATSSGLKQHTHIHSSVKPFRCEVCLKAYTQFSNLCRHKRMRVTCRLQIKCNKCGQAFSTVTSLSKHKRFCEGTAFSTDSAPTRGQLSSSDSEVRPNASPASPLGSPGSSYLGYPRPAFPFYPNSLFGFSNLLAASLHNPATGEVSPKNNFGASTNSRLDATVSSEKFRVDVERRELLKDEPISNINKDSNTAHECDERIVERTDENKEFIEDIPVKSDALLENEEDVNITSEPNNGSDTDQDEDAQSHCSDLSATEVAEQSDAVHELSEKRLEKENMSSNRTSSPKQGSICPESSMLAGHGYLRHAFPFMAERGEVPFDLSRNKAPRISLADDSPEFKSRVKEEATGDEFPLDLSVTTQKKQKTINLAESLQASYRLEMSKHLGFSDHPPHKEVRVDERPRPSSPSPGPLSKLHENISSPFGKFPMAYPRPLHPMLLDMYRLQMETQQQHQQQQQPQPIKAPTTPAFPMFSDHASRFLPAFPAARGYPHGLLNPSLLGAPAATFDFMRAHMHEKMGKQTGNEMLTPQMIKAKERYTCKFCGKVFPRSANLTRHLRTHTGEQPYKCKYCERSFSISSNLQRHVRNIHNKEKPFKCPLCDRCFGQQTNLDRHLKKHESDGLTILDDSPKTSNDAKDNDAYFNDIRSFMGKVTAAGHRLIEPSQLLTANGYLNEKHLVGLSSPTVNIVQDDADDETINGDSDMEDEPSINNKMRLHSESSNNEDDNISVASTADSVEANNSSDTETNGLASSKLTGNNFRNGDFARVSRSMRADITSVVACLSRRAEQKQKLHGSKSNDEDEEEPQLKHLKRNEDTPLMLTKVTSQ